MPSTFGERLKQIRIEKNWSQEELAALLGTSKQVVSRYETNQRTPKITIANAYADKLHVPLTFLLGEDETELANEKPAVSGDDGLWKKICADDKKLRLIKWIAGLDRNGLDRIEKLLDAAEMLPKE